MNRLRRLPSVDALAGRLAAGAGAGLPPLLAAEVARRSIDRARAAALEGKHLDPEALAAREAERLARTKIQRVINATGVLLHTNLGRAPLHPEAADAARRAAAGYGNLEFDLTSGRRGSRGGYLNALLSRLTGAEAALAVNNNAAALFLTLHTLAAGGSVPVSRGELIEIGGSYRLPELMAASGARLAEVGATNRTRIADYERAAGPEARMLLKVHPSNYRVVGFTEEAGLEELAALGRRRGLPVVFDAGSGLLDAGVPWLAGPPPAWLAGEPGVRQSLAAGADLVLFSGDKLFGGCQAGVIAGRAEAVARLRSSPAARAVRIDAPSIAALSRTAELYAEGRAAEIPIWRMAALPAGRLRGRLERIARAAGVPGEVRTSEAVIGAGSAPGGAVRSPALVLEGRGEELWPRLLAAEPAVAARRSAGDLLIDVRAVSEEDDGLVAEALRRACRS